MLMTITEACAYAAIGRTTCYALLREGELEAAKVLSGTRITKRSLDAYIERAVARGEALRTRR